MSLIKRLTVVTGKNRLKARRRGWSFCLSCMRSMWGNDMNFENEKAKNVYMTVLKKMTAEEKLLNNWCVKLGVTDL